MLSVAKMCIWSTKLSMVSITPCKITEDVFPNVLSYTFASQLNCMFALMTLEQNINLFELGCRSSYLECMALFRKSFPNLEFLPVSQDDRN